MADAIFEPLRLKIEFIGFEDRLRVIHTTNSNQVVSHEFAGRFG
ncbi:hypothetical protein ES703_85674 [subsurface metagenome]